MSEITLEPVCPHDPQLRRAPRQCIAFGAERGIPPDATAIRREHVEAVGA